jgi:hypothetical protein
VFAASKILVMKEEGDTTKKPTKKPISSSEDAHDADHKIVIHSSEDAH